jgi:recombinational DNA repair ATPase RecF
VNAELRQLVEAKLDADGLLNKTVGSAVLAACQSQDELERYLDGEASSAAPSPEKRQTQAVEAYLTSLTVEGFRGVGPSRTLSLSPGPGLTLVIGRNGSGKSSFSEALEVLFTGDSQRWADRSKVWKDGWRNLHHSSPVSISADMLLAGAGSAKVSATWSEDDDLDSATAVVQPKGKPKTSLTALGWTDAVSYFRPFLSYNELGSMLDEGPSKLYDALSLVLGLDDIVQATTALANARKERQKALKDADVVRQKLLADINALIAQGSDERASAAARAIESKTWKLDELEKLLAGAAPAQEGSVLTALQQGAALEVPGAEQAADCVDELRQSQAALAKFGGTQAERSRKLAHLLEAALVFHEGHADADCPVCGTADVLGPAWADSTRREVAELKTQAVEIDRAFRRAEAARATALEMLRSSREKILNQLARVGAEGVEKTQKAFAAWNDGARLLAAGDLASHIEKHHAELLQAVAPLREHCAAELERRHDRWRPVATALGGWLPPAKQAVRRADALPFVKEAEDWLKKASAEIRDERFAPIAEQAMQVWRHLRQNSNVELGQIELTGTGTTRRVSLDVTVDGVAGAALGVMSQGELHSLALSLFLPRATLADSPFRFVVIDDPVQSMDPARVDGLARVLEDVSRSRQVVVFTHDDRLPEAVRRLRINATQLAVTRRPESQVEIRIALDPVKANIDDALALVHTAELPRDVMQRVVPGFCRSALEAAFMQVVRRRQLGAGQPHDQVEQELEAAGTLTSRAALALFDDKDRGGDVLRRLNQFGPWAGDAFQQCNKGAHGGASGDLKDLIKNTDSLCDQILALR